MIYGYYFDPTYILIVIGMVICLVAQAHVIQHSKNIQEFRAIQGLQGHRRPKEFLNHREFMM